VPVGCSGESDAELRNGIILGRDRRRFGSVSCWLLAVSVDAAYERS
jgi:hypothetical protein